MLLVKDISITKATTETDLMKVMKHNHKDVDHNFKSEVAMNPQDKTTIQISGSRDTKIAVTTKDIEPEKP